MIFSVSSQYPDWAPVRWDISTDLCAEIKTTEEFNMSQKSNAARTLVTAALIAAAYAALTYVSAAMGLAYGEVQFRLS